MTAGWRDRPVGLTARGGTGAGVFPGLPRLIGDRDTGDCTALRGGSWNAVVDVSGYERAAGLPATPLEVAAADVLARDRARARGEPPLDAGYSPEQERLLLGGRPRG